jgi:uncharacterized membrane protein YozB (DUF420 family)
MIQGIIAGQDGFLGTRAGFLSDLLLVSLLVLVPLGVFGFWLARRHRGATHRLVMLVAYEVVTIFVLIYVLHNLVGGFPPLSQEGLSLYNAVYLGIGLIHSALATAALYLGARQLYTGYRFTKDQRGFTMQASEREIHQRAGRLSLFAFLGTALTGALFYAWVFVFAVE